MDNERNDSKMVYPGADGRLVYTADGLGNVIPDFSHCGYMGGGVVLPEAPVVLTVEPEAEGDDTARLQTAIDAVCARLLDANGFRGALLLKRGEYRIGGILSVTASGVVLRGEGDGEDGTVLIATGKGKRTLVHFSGAGDYQYFTKSCYQGPTRTCQTPSTVRARFPRPRFTG